MNFDFLIQNENGVHVNPATKIAKLALGFAKTNISIAKQANTVDARSIVSILALEIKQGETVSFCFEGEEAEKASSQMLELLENGNF